MASPLSIDELRERTAAGEAFALRHFYGHTARSDGKLSNAVFSQFYPCRFEIGGEVYRWAEQWMMAGKARAFADTDALSRILAAGSPFECKQIGRQVRGFDPDRWNEVCFDHVTAGNVAKFSQDAALGAYLMATGDEILVEAARDDRVWGIGMSRDDPGAHDPLAWRGRNLLGFALVRTRGILKGELTPPSPLPI